MSEEVLNGKSYTLTPGLPIINKNINIENEHLGINGTRYDEMMLLYKPPHNNASDNYLLLQDLITSVKSQPEGAFLSSFSFVKRTSAMPLPSNYSLPHNPPQ
ncbi:MAG: hypothetical protein QXP80_01035 [Zestosphaera sp.]